METQKIRYKGYSFPDTSGRTDTEPYMICVTNKDKPVDKPGFNNKYHVRFHCCGAWFNYGFWDLKRRPVEGSDKYTTYLICLYCDEYITETEIVNSMQGRYDKEYEEDMKWLNDYWEEDDEIDDE